MRKKNPTFCQLSTCLYASDFCWCPLTIVTLPVCFFFHIFTTVSTLNRITLRPMLIPFYWRFSWIFCHGDNAHRFCIILQGILRILVTILYLYILFFLVHTFTVFVCLLVLIFSESHPMLFCYKLHMYLLRAYNTAKMCTPPANWCFLSAYWSLGRKSFFFRNLLVFISAIYILLVLFNLMAAQCLLSEIFCCALWNFMMMIGLGTGLFVVVDSEKHWQFWDIFLCCFFNIFPHFILCVSPLALPWALNCISWLNL